MKKDKIEKKIRAIELLKTYKVIKKERIEELDSYSLQLAHIKTGARIFLLLNEDENKVFTIGFRTPSINSTGVAHILEHSVLCGSKKFPSKDPFVELVKGSLNTFLNAMTYPDKTVYPVASCNDKDFCNLMEVYLDAVLYPNIYREEKIFKQEGWHYELASPDDNLKINGVVYNEMKGVFSSVDSMLERVVSKSLFEGHSYGEESGGDPEYIPELTYEDFLDFHGRYYHPSNAFIYLYGDTDAAERLDWIDREYLSKFVHREVDSKILPVKAWSEPRYRHFEYSITETENTKNADYLSLHTVVGGELDPLLYTGFQILDYVLLNVPGAPLQEALIDAGIGEEISGGYQCGISEPYFSVTAKNTSLEQKGEFLAVVKGILRKLANTGLDKKALKAAINIMEFKAREADFGGYPRGLIYGLNSFDSWLYGGEPTLHLKYKEVFAKLRKGVEEGFFEKLISDYLLDNPFEVCITLSPKKNLTKEKEEKLKKKLLNIQSKLSREEIDGIIRETRELKEYQSTPSSQEDLMKIPMLKREDIKKEAEKPVWEKRALSIGDKNIEVIFSEVFTAGIAYLKFFFDASKVDREELPYLAFLKELFTYTGTKNFTYADLSTELNLNSGGLGFGFTSYGVFGEDKEKEDESKLVFSVNTKILYDKFAWAGNMAAEILLYSDLENKKRIKELLLELKTKYREKIVASGHVSALNRAGSHISKTAYFNDATEGIRFYRFLEKYSVNFDENVNKLIEKLQELVARLFYKDNLKIHLTADEEGYRKLTETAELFYEKLPVQSLAVEEKNYTIEKEKKSEGFTTASQVNYVARAGNFKAHGFEYTGALKILKLLLSYDYLWNNIRVKGGAYGCAASFNRNGDTGFASYRDPKLRETDRVYEKITEFVSSFEADERKMTQAVIGVVSGLDAPLTPLAKGLRGLTAYLSNIDFERIMKEREEVLNVRVEDIRALAPMIEAVLSDEIRCAIGNITQIQSAENMFTDIMPIVSLADNSSEEANKTEEV